MNKKKTFSKKHRNLVIRIFSKGYIAGKKIDVSKIEHLASAIEDQKTKKMERDLIEISSQCVGKNISLREAKKKLSLYVVQNS